MEVGALPQSAGMEAGRDEGRAERLHPDRRREVGGGAEVVGAAAPHERRAGRELGGNDVFFSH